MSITNYTGTYQNYLGYLGAKKCCELRGLGPKGDQGATGPPGPIGIGEKGAKGDTGDTGAVGPAGSSGLYCLYGNTQLSQTIGATPFTVTMQGGSLLKDQMYAVNISVYITGSVALSSPNVTLNLSNNPEVGGAPFYPQIFKNSAGGVPMYLTSGSGSSPYYYTGSINDYVYYTPSIDLNAPIINVYITPSSSDTYTIKIVATVNPVSG